eukprot:COSAG01_NODE_54690_length_330_cov_0.952381_1_plen_65_part_10
MFHMWLAALSSLVGSMSTERQRVALHTQSQSADGVENGQETRKVVDWPLPTRMTICRNSTHDDLK